MRRSIKEMTDERKQTVDKPRDYFQRPRVPDNPEHSGKASDYSGSSWSGERWSGNNQSSGRDR